VGYTGGVSAKVLHARLAGAAPGLTGAEGEARGRSPCRWWRCSARSTPRSPPWTPRSAAYSPPIPTGTFSLAEACTARFRHHLRRPVPGRRDLLTNRRKHRS
jgi:hypothetical protein